MWREIIKRMHGRFTLATALKEVAGDPMFWWNAVYEKAIEAAALQASKGGGKESKQRGKGRGQGSGGDKAWNSSDSWSKQSWGSSHDYHSLPGYQNDQKPDKGGKGAKDKNKGKKNKDGKVGKGGKGKD